MFESIDKRLTRMVDVHAKTGAPSDFRAVDGLVSALNLFFLFYLFLAKASEAPERRRR